jgi:hypothetical protein
MMLHAVRYCLQGCRTVKLGNETVRLEIVSTHHE